MLQEPLTLYKLIVLYLLKRAALPLSKRRVCDFILDKGYTNYIILNQAIGELMDAGMITLQLINERSHLSITEEGAQTLAFFQTNISDVTKEEINTYLKENKLELLAEISVTANYDKASTGEFEAHLIAKEKDIPLVQITLSVPEEETAASICRNWREKNEEIYQFLVERLF
ncbi:MAG: DUF4364 family protein [Lachnospiraceae bacterium]|nr:DUF4364 family protein [Lachnospiraceae bacterium]